MSGTGCPHDIPAMKIASGNTSERYNDSDLSSGYIRYNTEENYLELYHSDNSNQSNWYPLRENKHGEKNFDDVLSSWFLRLSVADEPGVLAEIAGTLGENNVSIESVIQEGRGDEAELVLITHEAPEKALENSLNQLTALTSVSAVMSTLRVYS